MNRKEMVDPELLGSIAGGTNEQYCYEIDLRGTRVAGPFTSHKEANSAYDALKAANPTEPYVLVFLMD